MLDTLKLRSPYVDEVTARAVEQCCRRTSAVEIATGEVAWSLTAAGLAGSWDHRVSVRVMREQWVHVTGQRLEPGWWVPKSERGDDKQATIKESCDPYLVVEGSVHKALLGHNVYGGPLDVRAAARWFVANLGERVDCSLPDGDLWTVERADWAEAFDMGSFEAVQEWVHGLSLARFPRRKVNRYSDEAVNFAGRTTTVNLYHKGPEFLVHDRKRLKACIGMAETAELLDLANRLLRFEVQVKGPKLEADFGAKPPVVQVTQAYLEGVHDREGSRLIREGKAEMDTVRTHTEVSNRLRQVYGTRRANTLFGTWMQLAALGEDHVKRGMNRATFYRQRKQLVEAAIAWHGADVCIVPGVSAVPRGFAPIRSDPRRMIGEAPEVVRQLAPFRLAA